MTTANKGISITKQVDLGIEDIIAGMSNLETPELERFMQRIGQIVARRKFSSVSEQERELLFKINNVIPVVSQERYALLSEKMQAETITPSEHKELLKLVEKLEAKYVKRLEYLIELARIRNLSLQQLMKQLHLNLDQEDD